MTDLAKSLRDKLAGARAHRARCRCISEHASADGTIKWLFDVGDGNAVETVFIPEDDRGTLCISSQAGCAVGCRFCSTGHQGFSRNLTHRRDHRPAVVRRAPPAPAPEAADGERVITNVVMMGMGEPLQNYAALVPALRMMLDDHGYGLSRRRVTVSTSGVVPMIDRLRDDCPVALAVSLHAPNDALRDDLVPLNRKYPHRRTAGGLQALPRRRAARLHHLRVLHARRRQRPARACARSWSRWCATRRRVRASST